MSVTTAAATYDDWRLPITFTQDCTGYNCTNSEMGHLYYTELGNVANDLSNTGDFQNITNGELYYWSGTTYTDNPPYAWVFVFKEGYQEAIYASGGPSTPALAVRDGLAVVPEPISSVLFIAGGATLGLRRFWKKRKTA